MNNPSNLITSYFSKIDNYVNNEEYQKARACLNKILKKDPGNLQALIQLSEVFLKLNLVSESKRVLKKVMQIDAHSAEADTKATYEILQAQLDKYSDLENDIEKLSAFSSHNTTVDFVGRIIADEKGIERFNFGKYKGKAVEEILEKDPAYYGWMMKSDFPLYTKKVLTSIKLRGAFGKA